MKILFLILCDKLNHKTTVLNSRKCKLGTHATYIPFWTLIIDDSLGPFHVSRKPIRKNKSVSESKRESAIIRLYLQELFQLLLLFWEMKDVKRSYLVLNLYFKKSTEVHILHQMLVWSVVVQSTSLFSFSLP